MCKKEKTNMGREVTQEHIMKICLPPELYLAVTKFQSPTISKRETTKPTLTHYPKLFAPKYILK